MPSTGGESRPTPEVRDNKPNHTRGQSSANVAGMTEKPVAQKPKATRVRSTVPPQQKVSSGFAVGKPLETVKPASGTRQQPFPMTLPLRKDYASPTLDDKWMDAIVPIARAMRGQPAEATRLAQKMVGQSAAVATDVLGLDWEQDEMTLESGLEDASPCTVFGIRVFFRYSNGSPHIISISSLMNRDQIRSLGTAGC